MELLCKWCQQWKPDDQFIKRVASEPPSQRNVRCCKECQSAYSKKRYGDPGIRAKQLKANARWRDANPDRMRAHEKRFADANPENVRARNRVRHLIRSGFWTKQPCVVCGRSDYVEAHHDSYAEPHWEVVRWLCKEHHESWHSCLDPVKHQILEEPLAEVGRLKTEAMDIQKEILALRNKYRDVLAKANEIEIQAWNKVIEKGHPLFQQFCKKG